MTKSIAKVLVGALFISMFALHGCSRFEDGPGFSLRTVTARLTGKEWNVEKLYGDALESDEIIVWEFDKDGEMKSTYIENYLDSNGQSMTETDIYVYEWKFEDGKTTVELKEDNFICQFEILRLTNKEMVLEDEDGDTIEFEAN